MPRNKDDCFKWFESYLNGRFLKVILDCSISKCYPITCGVPQGSVLGPLLYLIYCDSMRFYIPRAKITSFADDTALTVTGKTLNELTDNANEALKGLHTFVSLSRLAINTTKTNFMTFTRIGTAPTTSPGAIIYNGTTLAEVQETRYLGFIVNNKLSRKKHSDVISWKVSRGVGMLRKLNFFFSNKVMLSLYHSVSSYINYECMIWASDFYTNYKREQVQQNKAVRIIGNYDRGTDSTLSIFKKLNSLNVGQIKHR